MFERLRQRGKPPGSILLLAGLILSVVYGCSQVDQESQSAPPNILLIILDTVRMDHMGVYGHERKTTPYLSQWSQQARVYDFCVANSCTTVPSHASIFTGLTYTEHGADNSNQHLPDEYVTLAEVLRDQGGYRTYLYSENPRVSEVGNFQQGFDRSELPSDPRFRQRAYKYFTQRVPQQDIGTTLAKALRSPQGDDRWTMNTAPQLAQEALLAFLEETKPSGKPYLAVLNYMQAHYPVCPPLEQRQALMTPAEVQASLQLNRVSGRIWQHVFGAHHWPKEQLRIFELIYDAAILDLDGTVQRLLAALEQQGLLENTVVVITADHGEHQNEHGLLSHEYSVYEALLRVPLIIHYPPRFKPGKDSSRVALMDLYPTLLELAGQTPVQQSQARSLLQPIDPSRPLVGAFPMPDPPKRSQTYKQRFPNLDVSFAQRSLQAFYAGEYKLIWASDDRHELYHLPSDPEELNNLFASRPTLAKDMLSARKEYLAKLQGLQHVPNKKRELPAEFEEKLKSLGYVGGDGEDETE